MVTRKQACLALSKILGSRLPSGGTPLADEKRNWNVRLSVSASSCIQLKIKCTSSKSLSVISTSKTLLSQTWADLSVKLAFSFLFPLFMRALLRFFGFEYNLWLNLFERLSISMSLMQVSCSAGMNQFMPVLHFPFVYVNPMHYSDGSLLFFVYYYIPGCSCHIANQMCFRSTIGYFENFVSIM